MMNWRAEDIAFTLLDDLSADSVITVEIRTAAGLILIMAEPEDRGRTLILRRTHVQSEGGPNTIGVVNLRLLANVVMERMDYDEIIVEGAIRTTGAKPGRQPRPQRFAHRRGAPSALPSNGG
jgi:hypothetical protein